MKPSYRAQSRSWIANCEPGTTKRLPAVVTLPFNNAARPAHLLSSEAGYSLMEVMIAALIFTLLALSATALFIQNQRMIYAFRYRTHVTNAALNILEQLRLKQYAEIKALHDGPIVPATTIRVNLVDPTYTPPSPAPADLLVGYRPIDLNINVVDGNSTPNQAAWTPVDLALENSPGSPMVHAQFWTTLKANISTTAPVVELFEIVVMYQWKNPVGGGESSNWLSGTIRLTIPNPNPKTT